ncbi:RtcB family protein [Streptomyces sp. NPDC058745]|uniref:RtcB family protein n=1 Tax=Streptomyces sp. NPDC058745 TaxID=3346621 RepID=UPI0036BAAECB
MACAPAVSTPGSAYLRAMAAANYGRANRQLLTEAARHAFTVVAGGRLDLVHDVSRTMGTASYVMAGVVGNAAFWSSAHGAGRVWSRHRALRRVRGEQLHEELESHGIAVRPKPACACRGGA